MAASSELKTAIERLYETFAPYTAPVHPAYCEHCVTEPEDVVLRTKPIRELSAQELERYAFKAISTWGTVEQFKHLLPRLFELVTENEFGFAPPEILFKKPRYGEFATWPDRERHALQFYCDSLWRCALANYPLNKTIPAFGSIDDCLCSVAQVVDDLGLMLALWDQDATTNTLHLADFAAENASTMRESSKLSNAFWDERPNQVKQVIDWFMTHDFAMVFDLVEIGTMPSEFREELVRAIRKR